MSALTHLRVIGPTLFVVACSAAPQTPTPSDETPPPTWYTDARPIMERSCLACHGADGGLSGIPLDTYEAIDEWSGAIRLAVEEDRMPPWGADNECRNYKNNFSLDSYDKERLLEWIDNGLEMGDEALATDHYDPFTAPPLDRVDRSLPMPVEYTPVAQPDDYRCFLMPWPEEETVWVTGYDYTPGNADIVHHIISFIANPGDIDMFQALDDADPNPGYSCYGGPGGDVTTLINTGWLGAWAPGGGAVQLPEGKGIEVAPGSMIVMQMHYYSTEVTEIPDLSVMEIEFETTEQEWAEIIPWTEVSWVFGDGMEIPANTNDVTHTFEYENGAFDGSYKIQSASLHMHTLGKSGRLEVEHADGSIDCALDIPRWDFNWQRDYYFRNPIQVRGGDTVRLECTWDNPTDQDVIWGDGTDDEMCLGVTLLTD